jgi:transcriptional antiterminator RfaH
MADSCLFRPDAQWYVVRTHQGDERRVQENLRRSETETFLPLMSGRRRRVRCAVPLFPQYLFARFDAYASLHKVCYTRGVQNVVRFGSHLAIVGDEVIALFRSRGDSDGLIRVGEPLGPGERVTIEDGPFAALAGVVERQLTDKERVIVLLTTVQAAVRIEVPTEFVQRAPVERPPDLRLLRGACTIA